MASLQTGGHPSYSERAPQWQRCRDAYEGEDAVKDRGREYLPELSRQHKDYGSYLLRASLFPAMGRTVEGMVGCVIRKPAEVEGSLDLDDVAGQGIGLHVVIEQVLRELLIAGRTGILANVVEGRAEWSVVQAEDVLSWLMVETEEGPRLGMAEVKVGRYQEVDAGIVERVEFRRVYRRGAEGVSVVSEPIDRPRETQTFALETGSGPMMEIPLWLADLPSGTLDLAIPAKPPLLDLVDLSLSHYRSSADMEHALHWAAVPTPWIATTGKPPKELGIGSTQVWNLGKDGTAGFLEISGTTLDPLANALRRKQQQMAAIGAATLLAEPNRVAETAEAVRLKAGGDHSMLHRVVTAAERSVTEAMKGTARWLLESEEVGVTINRDWLHQRLSPEDARVLLEMLQAQAITPQQFARAIHEGEWTAEAIDPPGSFEPQPMPAAFGRMAPPEPEQT